MFPHLDTPDFVRAVTNVRDKGFPVDETLACSIINKMHELKGRGKFGLRFKQCRNIALTEHGITDLLTWGAYKTIVFGYFHPRAMRAQKNIARNKSIAKEMPASNVSDVSVRLQVSTEIYITFSIILSARGKSNGLTWDDIDNGTKEVLSGSKSVAKNHWLKAKRKAFKIIKDRLLKKACDAM